MAKNLIKMKIIIVYKNCSVSNKINLVYLSKDLFKKAIKKCNWNLGITLYIFDDFASYLQLDQRRFLNYGLTTNEKYIVHPNSIQLERMVSHANNLYFKIKESLI